MNRKGHQKRSKMRGSVRPVTTGEASSPTQTGDETASASAASEMVEATSSPHLASVSSHHTSSSVDFSGTSVTAEASDAALGGVATEWSSLEERAGRDDISVPPIDLDTGFFDREPVSAESSLEIDTRDPRVAWKLTHTAARRRAHLAKYVGVTVVLSCALCMAALVKSATARGHDDLPHDQAPHTTAAVAVPAATAALNPATTTEHAASPPSAVISAASAMPTAIDPAPTVPVAPEATSAPAGAAEPPAQGTTASGAPGTTTAPAQIAAATPPTSEAPAGAATGAAAPPPASEEARPDPKTASREKAKSQAALEAGRLGDAVVSGERSVALDPGDAEAWLILGAAYQAKGALKESTRCFKSCIGLASRGPKAECAAMLRQQ